MLSHSAVDLDWEGVMRGIVVDVSEAEANLSVFLDRVERGLVWTTTPEPEPSRSGQSLLNGPADRWASFQRVSCTESAKRYDCICPFESDSPRTGRSGIRCAPV